VTASDSFDRLRPRGSGDDLRGTGAEQPDHEGKRALFSDAVHAPAPGTVAIACGQCGRTSVVSPVRLARLSLPGLHVPLPRGRRVSWRAWLRCPECDERSWVHISVR
jgi:hypothetical protein